MATPNVGILTNSGKNLIDQVNAGQTKITFSKIIFSSMENNQLTDNQIKALTTVAPQEVVVNNPEVTLDKNTGETRIRATGNNEALTDGVYFKTYAVYAKDDSGNESLYGLTVSPNPNYLPEYDGVTPQAVTYSYKVNISNTGNITFTNSNDVYVSETDLAEALQPYAKTVDVNQQLDKKVSIADMRKPASDVAGIEEVNAKQNVIGYTPADDSKVVHSDDLLGGRNLLLNTQKMTGYDFGDNGNKATVTIEDFDANTKMVHVVADEQDYQNAGIYLEQSAIEMGDYWTLSFDIKGMGVWTSASIENSNITVSATDITTDWTRKVVKGNKVTAGGALIFYFDASKSAVDVYIKLIKVEHGSIATDWTPAPEDKADDSKVAHLSGANNFDTVPTVNNNPLLLASSLPSDLARTSQQTNFTAGLQSGGVSVATSDDLKSVVNSAWRQLEISGNNYLDSASILYKPDPKNQRVFISMVGDLNSSDYLQPNVFINFFDLSEICTVPDGTTLNIASPTGSGLVYIGYRGSATDSACIQLKSLNNIFRYSGGDVTTWKLWGGPFSSVSDTTTFLALPVTKFADGII